MLFLWPFQLLMLKKKKPKFYNLKIKKLSIMRIKATQKIIFSPKKKKLKR